MEYTNPVNNKSNEQKEKQERMKMSDRFITAMFLPKEYDKLLKLKMGKMISYFLVLVLLVSIIQYAIPTLGAVAGMGGIKNIILNEIPDFSLKDGRFSYDEKVEKLDEEAGIYFMVDTSVDKFTREDVPDDVIEAIMVSNSNMLVYNKISGLGGITQEETFDHYKDFTITNQTVADASLAIYLTMLFIFIMLYVMLAVEYLFSGLFYALVMYLLTKTMLMEMNFGTVYKIALFAKSTGAIVMAITYCINNNLFILAGSSFNMLLTIIIMNKVLLQMKLKQDSGTMNMN